MLEDDREAVKWYRKAAEQGYAKAQYNLGVMYFKGEGVADDAEAVKWYRKSAEQGFAFAQRNLAYITPWAVGWHKTILPRMRGLPFLKPMGTKLLQE